MFKNLSEQEGGQQWTQHQVFVRRASPEECKDGRFPLGVKTSYRAYTSEHAYEFHAKERIPSKTLAAEEGEGKFRWQALPVESPWCPSLADNQANLGLDFEGMWVLRDVPNGEKGGILLREEFVPGFRENLDATVKEVHQVWAKDRPGTSSPAAPFHPSPPPVF